jgi:hypothetical protein
VPAGALLLFKAGGIARAIDDAGNVYQIGLNDMIMGPYAKAQTVEVLVTSGSIEYVVDTDGDASDVVKFDRYSNTITDPASLDAVRGAAGGGAGASGYTASLIGDSRTQDYYLTQRATGARSWIAQMNAYAGASLTVVAEYATSAQRSDQYFAEPNFTQMLNDGASIAIIGYPFVNDIDQALSGYTDTDGVAVTLVNVADRVLTRLANRVERLIESGKTVVVCTEPGSSNFAATQVPIVHGINAALRSAYSRMFGVRLFDPVDLIWGRGTDLTAITFRSGYSADGTHATSRQGNAIGRYAAKTLLPRLVPAKKSYGNDPLTSSAQLWPNAGYATATGGTTSNITGSDALPANTQLTAATAGRASYAASIAPAEDGSGNELTLTITATDAVVVELRHVNMSMTGVNYTSQLVGGCDCTVVSASGCRVYGEMQVFTGQGTVNGWALYAGDAADIWMFGGTVDELRLQSDPTRAPAGSTSGLAPSWRVRADFKSAGSVVMKLKDPTIYKVA